MKSSIKSNFIFNLLYQILCLFVPLITTPYISRILGVSGIGTYSYYFTISQYFGLFIMLGINNYGNRLVAINKDDSFALSKKICEAYSLQFLLGIIVIFSYFIYLQEFSTNKIMSLIMVIQIISYMVDINWLFWGLEEFKLIICRNFFIKLFSTVFIFSIVNKSDDLYLYSIIIAGSNLVSSLLLFPYIRKNIFWVRPTIKGIFSHLRPNLSLFVTVIAIGIYNILNKILLGTFSNTSEVGYYESVIKIWGIPMMAVSALGTVMLPRMSYLLAHNKIDEDNNTLLFKSFIFAFFLSTSLSLGIMGVSDVFVPWFFGKGFEKCIILILIIFPSCIFLAMGNVIRTQILLPRQMDCIYIVSTCIGAVVNIIISLVLIPYYGAIGAAIATLFTESSVCLYQLSKTYSYLQLSKYYKILLSILLSGIIMFFIEIFIKISMTSLIFLLIEKVLAGIIVFFVSLFILVYVLDVKSELRNL